MIVNTPWMRASEPLTAIAASRPSARLPVAWAVANPLSAPINIIPSTPRFRTPPRSANTSPMVAKSTAVLDWIVIDR